MKAIIVLDLLDGINLDNKNVSVYINGVKNAEGFLLKPMPKHKYDEDKWEESMKIRGYEACLNDILRK